MSRSIVISAKYKNNKKSCIIGLHNTYGAEYEASLWKKEEYNHLTNKIDEFLKQNKNKKIKCFEVSIYISCCNNYKDEDYLNHYETKINFDHQTTLKSTLKTIFLINNTILKHNII